MPENGLHALGILSEEHHLIAACDKPPDQIEMRNDMSEAATQLPAESDSCHRNQSHNALRGRAAESAIQRQPAALDWFPIDFDCEIIGDKLCKP